MRFSFSNSHVQNKERVVSKFALPQVNEFQLEVNSTEGKFALRQKTLLQNNLSRSQLLSMNY